MDSPFILCLDFDGVICDSAIECLVSSWIAYFDLLTRQRPAAVDINLKNAFLSLRPFIRSGEDYVLIQELIDHRVAVRTQEDFDAQIKRVGTRNMELYKRLFYEAREGLIERNRDYWLSLNELYTHMRDPLRDNAGNGKLYIVSTKRSDFILEILRANGIPFPSERVLYAGPKGKADLVAEILRRESIARAFFVDDQIDHLTGGQEADIVPCLAAWGYVKKEWLQEPRGVCVFYPEEMQEIFKKL